MRSRLLAAFLLGIGLFGVTEGGRLLSRGWLHSASPWVMEPNAGIATALLIHFAGALSFSCFLQPTLRGYLAFSAGVAIGIVIMLFVVGPGNLWPIALAIDCGVLTPALAGGFLVGDIFGR